MPQLAVDTIVPLSLEACVTRLRNRSKQMSKQRTQKARELRAASGDLYHIEVIPDGKDVYNVQVSKEQALLTSAELDVYLKKKEENQTLVIGTTRISMLTKLWTVFVLTFVAVILLSNLEAVVLSRLLIALVVGLVIGLWPLFAAQRMKRNWLGHCAIRFAPSSPWTQTGNWADCCRSAISRTYKSTTSSIMAGQVCVSAKARASRPI